MLKLSEISDSIVEKYTINELEKQKELFTEIISESLSNLSVTEKNVFKELQRDNSLKIQLVDSVFEKMFK